MKLTRRETFGTFTATALAAPAAAAGARCNNPLPSKTTWAAGIEGQRKADLGNGMFLNPIVPGDHPDPTVLKDGDDYYMTFSSFVSYPGIVIWHSRDLVNWTPVGPALKKPIGSIWAMDLVKHGGRYFIYIPAVPVGSDGAQGILVIWADDIRGPWSDPIDLKLPGCIDPGHAVGEDGKRYLFLNGIRYVRLTDDGLATDGELKDAYRPWQYPKNWVVEMFAPEGPKITRRGDYFYLVTAVGGTSGPPTSHMVIAARSKSVHGPWEHCPHNPLVRTQSADEPWWSRGHASLVEGPAGDWWMIYHGYENGFRTLGRQPLLDPIEWTADGWFIARGGDLSRPLPKPKGGQSGPAGFPLSDDFRSDKFGLQWSFQSPAPDEMTRVRRGAESLVVAGRGTSPSDSSPLGFIVGDRNYEISIVLDVQDGGEGGLLLFYSNRAFVGIGFNRNEMRTFNYSEEQSWLRTPLHVERVHIRMRNIGNIVTFFYTLDGASWTQHPWQMEVSGFHHNVFGGFMSLKPAIYSAGKGSISIRTVNYRAFPS